MLKGENALVEWLRMRFGDTDVDIPIGIGDDMGVIRVEDDLVAITCDMLLDGVHFDTREHSYEMIGRKAIACSLSDCAAMGCQPRAAAASLALPDTMSLDDVKRLYEGMAGIADEFDCTIVGGDTTSWRGGLAIDVAMVAEPMAVRGPIRRSDAQPGQIIYVSGPLGGSRAGRHLTFTPRLDLASRLVQQPALRAMMDISDGLSLDLHRLCMASGCDAELDADQLEYATSDAAREYSRKDGRSPLQHVLEDGEDFELLVVGTEALRHERLHLIAVGRTVARARPGVSRLVLVQPDGRRQEIEPRGYEHFR